jgi:hypothetical protein
MASTPVKRCVKSRRGEYGFNVAGGKCLFVSALLNSFRRHNGEVRKQNGVEAIDFSERPPAKSRWLQVTA